MYERARTIPFATEAEMSIEWVLPKTRSSSWFDISCLGGLSRSPEVTHPWGPKKPDKVVLYLHGGAYLLCTPASLRGITFSLAGALKAEWSDESKPSTFVSVKFSS